MATPQTGSRWRASANMAVMLAILGTAASSGALLETPAGQIKAGKEKAPPRFDAAGDRLPEGALFRLGTDRLRHGGNVTSLAYSPDSKIVASGGMDWRLRLWHVDSGKPVFNAFLTNWVTAVAFAPHGNLVAAGTRDGEIQIWTVPGGKQQLKFKGHQESISQLIFSRQGDLLVSAGRDGKVCIWDAETGANLVKAAPGAITAMALSPDNKHLAIGDPAGKMHFLELATGKKVRQLEASRNPVSALGFSPDNKVLASAGDDGVVQFWDVEASREIAKTALAGAPVTSLAFVADGKHVVSGDVGGRLKLLEVTTGKEVRRLGEHVGSIRAVAVSPDGRVLASGGADNCVRLMDLAKGQELFADGGHQGQVTGLAMAPGGSILISAGADATVRFWDLGIHKEVRRMKTADPLLCVACSPKGDLVAAGGVEKLIRLWNAATGEELKPLTGPENGTKCVAFSPDGQMLASVGEDQTVRLWSLQSRKTLSSMTRPNNSSTLCLAFSPDGKLLASSGTQDTMILLYETESGREIGRLPASVGATMLAFSLNGRELISASLNCTIQFWEVASGKLRHQLGPFNNSKIGFTALAVAPDRRRLAVFPSDRKFQVFDLMTAAPVGKLTGHSGWVRGLAFSPDGKRLYSASEDTTILAWDFADHIPPVLTQAMELEKGDLELLWAKLVDENAAAAYQAMGTLVKSPSQVIVMMKSRLQPTVEAKDVEHIVQLVKDLDNDKFAVREKAYKALQGLSFEAEPALRKAMDAKLSLESVLRVKRILEKLGALTPDRLRILRALEVLEYIGTAEAREVVEALSRGTPGAWMTREATASLERWQQAAR
jgi:WD40 repeat protein